MQNRLETPTNLHKKYFEPCQKVSNRKRNKSFKQKVKNFYERDDNSTVTAGNKETFTRKKVKCQRRYLTDTIFNIYNKIQD